MKQMQRNMEEALRNIADNTRRGDNQGGHEANQYSSFKDLMDTKPPVFKEALEPLEADEWNNTMEQKFRLLWRTEELKAEYAAHQLQGPARICGPIIAPPTRGDPDHLEPLHHCFSGELYSSRCGGNDGWGVHEAVLGNEVCEGVSARF